MTGSQRPPEEGGTAMAELVELLPPDLDPSGVGVLGALLDGVGHHLDQLDRTVAYLERSSAHAHRWRTVAERSRALRRTAEEADGLSVTRRVRRLRSQTRALLDAVDLAAHGRSDLPPAPRVSAPAVPFAKFRRLLAGSAFAPGRLPTRWSAEAAFRTVALLAAKVAMLTPTVAGTLPSVEDAEALVMLGLPTDALGRVRNVPDVRLVVELLSRDVSIGAAVRSRVESTPASPGVGALLDLAAGLYVEGRTATALAVLDAVAPSVGAGDRLAVRRLRASWGTELGRATHSARQLLEVLDHLVDEGLPESVLVEAEIAACLARSARSAVAGRRPRAVGTPPLAATDLRAAALGLVPEDLEVLACSAHPRLTRSGHVEPLGTVATAVLLGVGPEEVHSVVRRVGDRLLVGPAAPSAVAALPLASGHAEVVVLATADRDRASRRAPSSPDGAIPGLTEVVEAALACGLDLTGAVGAVRTARPPRRSRPIRPATR